MNSLNKLVLQRCATTLAVVEVELIVWRHQLEAWKERLDAEVPAQG